MRAFGIFLGGMVLGSVGVKLLCSKEAKQVYVQCAAAALRAKDSVMKTVSAVQENAEDILAEAREVNAARAAASETAAFEDVVVEAEEESTPEPTEAE